MQRTTHMQSANGDITKLQLRPRVVEAHLLAGAVAAADVGRGVLLEHCHAGVDGLAKENVIKV